MFRAVPIELTIVKGLAVEGVIFNAEAIVEKILKILFNVKAIKADTDRVVLVALAKAIVLTTVEDTDRLVVTVIR